MGWAEHEMAAEQQRMCRLPATTHTFPHTFLTPQIIILFAMRFVWITGPKSLLSNRSDDGSQVELLHQHSQTEIPTGVILFIILSCIFHCILFTFQMHTTTSSIA